MGDHNDEAQAALLEEVRRMRDEMAAMRRQQQQQPGIGASDTPHTFYSDRSAICLPPLERQDYEIKPQLISLVERHPFHGLPAENPMDHIERFESVCGTTKANGVPADYIKLKLFPFSIADKAERWLKSLPPKSLTTWDQVRAVFLDHFFTKSKTAALRYRITNFQQLFEESFCDAWERFKEYKRECPHHGYTEEQLLQIFYDGVNRECKNGLNAASNGDFMTQSEQGAIRLIENLAASSYNQGADLGKSSRVNSLEAQKIDELDTKLDLLLKATSKKSVSFADANAIGNAEEKDVNFVGGGYGQRFPQGQFTRNYGNSSYQPPPKSDSKVEAMLEMLLEGQTKMTSDFNSKIDSVYTELSGRIEAISSHVKKLDVQVAQTAEAVKRQEGFLPGKTDTNPKQYVNMVQLKSEKPVQKRDIAQFWIDEQLAWEEKYGKHALVSPCVDRHKAVRRSTQDLCRSTQKPAPIDTCAASIDTDLCVDRRTTRDLDKSGQNEPKLTDSDSKTTTAHPKPQKQPEEVPERVYKPRIPYPKPPKTSTVPVPPVVHPVKAKVPKVEEKPAQPTLRTIKKMTNPGKFVISCSINGKVLENCLCDTGANVNVMTQAVAKELGILDSQPPKNSIQGLGTIRLTPKGFAPDLMVRVGDCLVPTDFHIVESGDDCKTPIILGSSFLTTAGALVDCSNQRISFSNVDKNVFYPFVPDIITFCISATLGEPLRLEPAPVIVKPQNNPKENPKRTSSPFAKVSIKIPLELQDKGDDTIRQELQKTMELFPRVRAWDLHGGLLVAQRKVHGRSIATFAQDEGGKEPLKDPPDA